MSTDQVSEVKSIVLTSRYVRCSSFWPPAMSCKQYILRVVSRSHRGLESSEIRRLKALTLLFQTVYRRAFTVSMVSFGAAMKLATKSMYTEVYTDVRSHYITPSLAQKLGDTPFESPARQLSIEPSFASRGDDVAEREGRITSRPM